MRTSKFRTVISLALVLCMSALDVGVVAKQKKKRSSTRYAGDVAPSR